MAKRRRDMPRLSEVHEGGGQEAGAGVASPDEEAAADDEMKVCV